MVAGNIYNLFVNFQLLSNTSTFRNSACGNLEEFLNLNKFIKTQTPIFTNLH